MNKNTIMKLSEKDMSTVTSNLLHTDYRTRSWNTRSNKQSL